MIKQMRTSKPFQSGCDSCHLAHGKDLKTPRRGNPTEGFYAVSVKLGKLRTISIAEKNRTVCPLFLLFI